jgi:hypothetical protein
MNIGYLRQIFRLGPERDLHFRERPLEHFKNEQYWRAWNTANAGKKAGSLGGRISIDGRLIDARRVVTALETGEWPDGKLTCFRKPQHKKGHDIDYGDGMPPPYCGVLRSALEEACEREDLPLHGLTVLSAKNDPFRIDGVVQRREAKWFREQFYVSVSATAISIHLRGLHYRIVAKGNVRKPGENDSGAGRALSGRARSTPTHSLIGHG